MSKQFLREHITPNAEYHLSSVVCCLSCVFEHCLMFHASDHQQCMKEFGSSGVNATHVECWGTQRYRAEIRRVFFWKAATAKGLATVLKLLYPPWETRVFELTVPDGK